MTTLLKKAIQIGFDKRQKPSLFLANLFEKKQLKTIKTQIQGRSIKSVYAVDSKIGTGGRRIEVSQHDFKDFIIPEYNINTELTEEDMYKVQFGETEETQVLANVADLINDRQEIISDMIRRSEEKQAADLFFNGKIVLADGTEIEFNKKATHDMNLTSKKWNTDNSDPLKDIEDACQLIIDDGKVSASEFNVIMGRSAINAFLGNAKVKGSSNWNNGIKRTDINIPIEKTPGAMFHGQISCGTYRVNLWSYAEKYEIPKGYNFANEGTSVPYIPTNGVLVLPTEVKYTRNYGSVNNTGATALIGGAKLQPVEVEQLQYSYDKTEGGSAFTIAGVKSRVLLIANDVDTFVTMKNVA